jgi:hypothetical protein
VRFFLYERERTWMSYGNVKEQDDGFCLCRGEGVFRESVTPSAARNSWWCYNSSGELVIVSAGFMRYGWRTEGCLPCVPSDKGGALTKSTPLTKHNRNVNSTIRKWGARWRSWLRHCATIRKVAGSISDGVIGIFHWHNPSGRTMGLGSTHPLTDIAWR